MKLIYLEDGGGKGSIVGGVIAKLERRVGFRLFSN